MHKSFDEQNFVDFLLRKKSKKKTVFKELICRKIVVLSKKELILSSKKYYKFPFEITYKNDKSIAFKKIRINYTKALKGVFANYRAYKEYFLVKYKSHTIFFGDNLQISKSFIRILINEEISYKEDNDYVLVNTQDAPFVYDFLINVQIKKDDNIPFILSKTEFENGIVSYSTIEKGPIVSSRGDTKFSYTIKGPLFTKDYEFDEKCEIEYFE